MRQVKRILAILLAVCFVISSTQISSYAQIDSGEDTLETVDTEDASDDEGDEYTSEFTDEIEGTVSVSEALGGVSFNRG
ncbi:MAG: hypothetical protein LUG54_01480 [Clostridiales bacterium]|nr:hypothetical protein [Clostridiales bacterium]